MLWDGVDPSAPPGHVTLLLERLQRGDRAAEADLLAIVYEPLRVLASSQLKGRRDALLQPTMLVHELFLRLAGKDEAGAPPPEWKNRGHFMAVAATAMRQILIDHLRRQGSAKRGGDMAKVSLSEVGAGATERVDVVDLIALDAALAKLQTLDPRQVQLVELKVFGGLSHPEIAEVTSSSLRTVEREWRKVRAWLALELGATPRPDEP